MEGSSFTLHSKNGYMKTKITDKISKNAFLYFLLKLFIFFLIVFVLDFFIGSGLKYYYFKQNSGFLYRTTYAIEEASADVLIFGSSKANHQYYPAIFEDRLKLSYYNVGRDGSSIFYHYAILKAVLKRYSPKMIILDISREFEKKQDSYDRISMLLPYYEEHPEMRQIIGLKSPYEKIKLISKIYPYNSLLFSIVAGNSEFNTNRYKDINGYVPLSNIWKYPIQTYSFPVGYELDSVKMNVYESFIKDCIKAKIKLYIVSSPDYSKLEYIEKSNLAGKEIAQKYNVKFFDYSKDSLFLNNSQFFADVSHLNDSGAIAFSNLIINEILKADPGLKKETD